MKYKATIFLTFVLLFLFMLTGLGEQTKERIIPVEWTWNPGSINTFSGEYDLSEYSGKTLSIRITTNLPADEDSENETKPHFTAVNGKRIPVLKQDDTTVFQPDEDTYSFSFTGQVRLPRKHRVRDVCFTLQITDENRKEITVKSATISVNDTASERAESMFYIPFDIRMITIILFTAAAIVWTITCYRHLLFRKRQRTGDQ